jgi:hypothetical protein
MSGTAILNLGNTMLETKVQLDRHMLVRAKALTARNIETLTVHRMIDKTMRIDFKPARDQEHKNKGRLT